MMCKFTYDIYAVAVCLLFFFSLVGYREQKMIDKEKRKAHEVLALTDLNVGRILLTRLVMAPVC